MAAEDSVSQHSELVLRLLVKSGNLHLSFRTTSAQQTRRRRSGRPPPKTRRWRRIIGVTQSWRTSWEIRFLRVSRVPSSGLNARAAFNPPDPDNKKTNTLIVCFGLNASRVPPADVLQIAQIRLGTENKLWFKVRLDRGEGRRTAARIPNPKSHKWW